jgi:hypothetical protein
VRDPFGGAANFANGPADPKSCTTVGVEVAAAGERDRKMIRLADPSSPPRKAKVI